MQVELSAVAPWAAIAVAVASLAYTIVSNRSKKIDDKIEQLKPWIESKASKEHTDVLQKRVELIDKRVTTVESELKHLPDKDTTHRLEIALKDLGIEVGRMAERIKPVAAMADRIQEALVEKVVG
ncbi:DUF2730 family protein [Rhodopseudomonas palustris]|uniref:DUF2730 family protein n=1 Tax=Rhodopseudomonas palustris TaxID=1076 RepID=A0A418V4A7_RHOPL|nr:DUF2730 family protein [Rhodopseudomonas palustris]RJF70887.1 DUF2730 family protein [Rhodopseudomonas palustris]